ncbi:3-hydroxybutyryl-CoA dehydrogenase [bacterium]|nr:3-hydroxybutyryl-CoA dehydrogenase [bacterium]
MGSGIAQVCAQNGIHVDLYDVSSDALNKALAVISKSLDRLATKSLISEDSEVILARINRVNSLDVFKKSKPDLLIEAATENPDLKKKIFSDLDSILPPSCIFASNTSSISITELAAVTKRVDRFIGVHFMNPVPLMKLVELITGLGTSEETLDSVKNFAKQIDKTTVQSKDMPGFIVNRILMPMINEACFALQDGLATVEDIDTAMKLGTNVPMGPLTLADFIGLDTCLYIMNVLYEGFGDSKYRPCPLLKQYVQAGRLGRKSGQGFYSY